ncbi:MAG: 2-oxoacid:acceptor oxidoreductase subunit alpha [Anaerolineae bacterium]|nr:2-oxoacid:acceptor oxidoreductase subunit alpha [Anaerolineae bacterium]
MPEIAINRDWCKGCYICVNVCPRHVLEIDQESFDHGFHPVVAARPDDCTVCRQCELLCPDLAISVSGEEAAGAPAGEAHVEPLAPAPRPLPQGWATAPSPLPAGRYFLQGDEACAEGAIAAGCNYYAGYPITPASEIMERICARFAVLLGKRVFVQMEDEIASIASCVGAAWAGAKAMTATSGPGISLMLENLGYAIITETPVVIVDVQRAGPSTGQATRPGQGDFMQVRWGAHGDYELIALSPWSVAEMYTETIRAFNLAERFRVPVILLADEGVGHLRENLTIPPEVRIFNRIGPSDREPPFGGRPVPPMPVFGEGHRVLVTGSTHDEWGYRRTSSARVQAELTARLCTKITDSMDEIVESETYLCDDDRLDLLLVSFGFTARSALGAARMAREAGYRVGLFRPRTVWPFPAEALRAVAAKSARVLVAEMNRGQMLREVQRVVPNARGFGKTDGEVIAPDEIWDAAKEYLR